MLIITNNQRLIFSYCINLNEIKGFERELDIQLRTPRTLQNDLIEATLINCKKLMPLLHLTGAKWLNKYIKKYE